MGSRDPHREHLICFPTWTGCCANASSRSCRAWISFARIRRLSLAEIMVQRHCGPQYSNKNRRCGHLQFRYRRQPDCSTPPPSACHQCNEKCEFRSLARRRRDRALDDHVCSKLDCLISFSVYKAASHLAKSRIEKYRLPSAVVFTVGDTHS